MSVSENLYKVQAPFAITIRTHIHSENITPYLPEGITEQQVIERLDSMYEANLSEDIKWAIQDIEECG